MDAKQIRSIVVATDLTDESERVVRAATSIAALTDAALYVLHVHVLPTGPDAEWHPGAASRADTLRRAERDLADQLRRVAPQHLAPVAQTVVTAASASEAIRQRAREVAADLVVLGPHRGSRRDLPFLGTTADRLIRTVDVPCLIVRGPMDFPVRRIGVLTDFSGVARSAQETAIAWMDAFSGGAPSSEESNPARISVAHIARSAVGSDREALETTKILAALRRFVDEAAERAGAPGGVEYAPEVLWAGDPADAIAGWIRARGLAMVVLGTQGSSGLPDPYLGGLASTVARSAPCSVLLVPPGYAPASARRAAEREAPLRRLVAGVDFHESSSDAALWAMRRFAPDARLELLHVIDLPELPGPLRALARGREQVLLAARDGARRRLEELRDLAGSPRVETHIREGKPATEILRLANETGADLIVVGEQGPVRGVGALLGSTAERVLFGSRVPVLVARKVGDAPPSRLLIGIDSSEVSGQLLAWTRALLARFDATAVLLNVVDRLLLFDELTGPPDARALRRLEEEAIDSMRDWLDTTVREAGLPAGRVRTKVLVGDPSYEIIAEAGRQGADLVLIGSKGGDVARTPMIGRIINRVVRSAPCSVLVVTRRSDPRVSDS
jgi:nucleotide-binding universal stress UspA family protein